MLDEHRAQGKGSGKKMNPNEWKPFLILSLFEVVKFNFLLREKEENCGGETERENTR